MGIENKISRLCPDMQFSSSERRHVAASNVFKESIQMYKKDVLCVSIRLQDGC